MRDVITFTTWNRPDYLAETLESWRKVRGIETCDLMFRCEPGSPEVEALARAATFGRSLQVTVNPERFGESRNPWEAVNDAFSQTDAQFVIYAEDDDVVSDDILEYYQWAAAKFWSYKSVVAVNAFQQFNHGRSHQARMEQMFQAWTWGTWRDRWEEDLRDDWDFLYQHKGYDWHIREHHVQEQGRQVIFPCQSRVQLIGKMGVHFRPETSRSRRGPSLLRR